MGWGISSSPAPQTGTLWIALLIPSNENETVLPSLSLSLGGGAPFLLTQVGTGHTLASSANVDDLFPGASPSNPISAYQAATKVFDTTYTTSMGYTAYLYEDTSGSFTTNVSGQTNAGLGNSFSFAGGDFTVGANPTVDSGIATGAIVTAFLDETNFPNVGKNAGGIVATAPSSSVVLDAPFAAAVPEPSTWAMAVAGFGLLGFAALRKGKREARLAV
jgi:hypothetical protein